MRLLMLAEVELEHAEAASVPCQSGAGFELTGQGPWSNGGPGSPSLSCWSDQTTDLSGPINTDQSRWLTSTMTRWPAGLFQPMS